MSTALPLRRAAGLAAAGVFVMAAIVTAGRAGAAESAPVSVKVGQVAPDFTLRDTAGQSWTLSKQRGSVVLLDFGRSMCMMCQQVAQELQRLHQSYAKQGLRVVQVNLDGANAPKVVPGYRREKKLTFPFLLDRTDAVAARYGLQVIPVLVMVGRDGKVAFIHQGYEEGFRATVERAVKTALSAKKR